MTVQWNIRIKEEVKEEFVKAAEEQTKELGIPITPTDICRKIMETWYASRNSS